MRWSLNSSFDIMFRSSIYTHLKSLSAKKSPSLIWSTLADIFKLIGSILFYYFCKGKIVVQFFFPLYELLVGYNIPLVGLLVLCMSVHNVSSEAFLKLKLFMGFFVLPRSMF